MAQGRDGNRPATVRNAFIVSNVRSGDDLYRVDRPPGSGLVWVPRRTAVPRDGDMRTADGAWVLHAVSVHDLLTWIEAQHDWIPAYWTVLPHPSVVLWAERVELNHEWYPVLAIYDDYID